MNHGEIVLEHDLLEALIALPEQLFPQHGCIATYVWVVTNRKAPARPASAAHRRDVVLDTDAEKPRRQATEIPFERARKS